MNNHDDINRSLNLVDIIDTEDLAMELTSAVKKGVNESINYAQSEFWGKINDAVQKGVSDAVYRRIKESAFDDFIEKLQRKSTQ